MTKKLDILVLILLLFIIPSLSYCQVIGKIESKAAESDTTHFIAFETQEITDPYVDVSPDGNTILFNVLGDLYTVSFYGGKARCLTKGKSWNVNGQYSPDGERIAFVSDRDDGMVNLWTMKKDGSDIMKYDLDRSSRYHHNWDIIKPLWTTDGKLIEIDMSENRLVAMTNPKRRIPMAKKVKPELCSSMYFLGSFSEDGQYGYTGGKKLSKVNLTTGESKSIEIDVDTDENMKLSYIDYPSTDSEGEKIAYVVHTSGQGPKAGVENCALYIYNIKTEKNRKLIDSLACDMPSKGYDFTPDGNSIVLGRLGKLVRIDVTTGKKEIIPTIIPVKKEVIPPLHHKPQKKIDDDSIRTKIIRWPTFNLDSSQLVYSAFGKIYTTNVKDGHTQRLTKDTVFEFAPALSPNGKYLAYTTWGDTAMGHVMVIPIKGGEPIQLTKMPGRYINPTWSPDGSKLAFISDHTEACMGLRIQEKGHYFYNWSLSLNWLPVFNEKGEFIKETQQNFVIELTPMADDQERVYPNPTFSSDSKRIFVNTHTTIEAKEVSPIIFSVKLDGSDKKNHLFLPYADEVVVSPDNKYVAIVREGQLRLIDISNSLNKGINLKADFTNAPPITTGLPTYVSWVDNKTLVWAEANKIYQYQLSDSDVSHLADIHISRSRDKPNRNYALVNARLITMKGSEVIEKGTIIIHNNRITEVGNSEEVLIPRHIDTIIDVTDKTIIPGLVDVHAHYHRAGKEIWQQQKRDYIGNLAYGVTTIYDPSCSNLDGFGYSEMVESGDILGPRIYSSGAPILGSDIQSGTTNFRDIQSLKDALRIVKNRVRYKSILCLKEYAQINRKQRQWLRTAAKKYDVLLTSHYEGHGRMRCFKGLTRIVDGFTAIEHELREGPLYEDITKFIAYSGVNYTPTLMVSPGGVRYYYRKEERANYNKLLRYNPRFLTKEKFSFTFGQRKFSEYHNQELFRASKILSNIVKNGGLVSVGGHGSEFPGLSTHQEMWAFTIGGMSIYEALRAATLNGAKKLDLDEEIGSIQPGKLADLVILNKNPLDDIYNSANIYYVVKNGRIYDGVTMTQTYPIKKELCSWPWEKVN